MPIGPRLVVDGHIGHRIPDTLEPTNMVIPHIIDSRRSSCWFVSTTRAGERFAVVRLCSTMCRYSLSWCLGNIYAQHMTSLGCCWVPGSCVSPDGLHNR